MSTFPPTARLLTQNDYSGVFNAADLRVSSAAFLVLALFNKENHSRLGIVVAKKHVRHAVRRNRLKRLVREHFRLTPLNRNLDLVVMARAPADALPNDSIWQHLEDLWQKLNIKAAQQ